MLRLGTESRHSFAERDGDAVAILRREPVAGTFVADGTAFYDSTRASVALGRAAVVAARYSVVTLRRSVDREERSSRLATRSVWPVGVLSRYRCDGTNCGNLRRHR